MLRLVWLTKQRNSENGFAVLLGGFDGLHVGHRRLLACAKNTRLPIGVMTIIGGKEEDSLFTFVERMEIFKAAGIDFALELPFEGIKDLSPQAFLNALEESCQPAFFVCGDDFRFGARAAGTPQTLKEYTQVRVEVQPLLKLDGEKVSSRRIKRLIQEGDVERANNLLGHAFFVIGEVYRDRGVGKTLGFPTANIQYPQGKCALKKGVYETRVTVDGKTYKGITNYGARPTFADQTVVTETYLDGFSGDLYGRKLKVEFVRFLRDITKFETAEALKQQLEEDIGRVRTND